MKYLLNCKNYSVFIVFNWLFDVFGECFFIKIYMIYVKDVLLFKYKKVDNYYDVIIIL